MWSHLTRWMAWGVLAAFWLAAVPAGPGSRAIGAVDARAGVVSPAVTVSGASEGEISPSVAQGAAATPGIDPTIEQGSRGVARNLLLAGIAVAAVIAVLSGVFALRHKKQ